MRAGAGDGGPGARSETRIRRQPESGFALLLVFLMAAAIALSLYMQIPRIAFQSQRQKEQLLIERGEQYKRAIQLFVRANGRYPAKMEDLETFNNRRYLRHKFVDPITGKGEWRIIHVNAAGVFTDSVRNRKKSNDADQQGAGGSTFVAVEPGIGSTLNPGQEAANNPALRRRASEGGQSVPILGPDGQPVQYSALENAVPGQPDALPQTPANSPSVPGGQVSGNPQPFPGGQPLAGLQIQPFPAGQPNPAAQLPAGRPLPPPQPFSPAQPNQPFVPPQPNQPFTPGQLNQPFTPGQGFSNPAGVTGAGPSAGINPIPAELNPEGVRGLIPAQPGQPNNTAASSFVGGSSSFVGGGSFVGGSSFVGGGSSFVGAGQATGPTNTPGFIPSNPIGQQNPSFPQTPQPPLPVPVQPPAQTFTPQTPNIPASGPNSATSMINNMLTSPRPQALPGATGTTPANAPAGGVLSGPGGGFMNTGGTNAANPGGGALQPAGQQLGGGIAGVASTSESPSIMVYNDRTNYNEWEFIFDLSKQRAVTNPNAGTIAGTPVQNVVSQPGAVNPQGGAIIPAGLPGAFGATPGASGIAAPVNPATAGNPNQPGAPAAGQQPNPFLQNSAIPNDIRLGRP